jgi:3-phenylpropionate/trans-cinnamate dioxygenase ferredoxin reductase subunit
MADRKVDHLLIGGGLAGASCAQALRDQGAAGSILLVGRELDAPYHRPPLSKGYLQGTESRASTFFKDPEWYAQHEIELLTRCSAMKLDPHTRTVKLSTREEVSFDKALLATGANVRRLNAPGAELDGIHYLRTLPNSDTIRKDAAGKRVVLIGGSYIGCEVAATLTELGSACAILMMEPVALSRTFGERAGRFFQDRLEHHGIEVHGGDQLERFEGADGRVTHVVTKNGLSLEADAVIIGAGVAPEVTLARGAGLELADGGGVHVSAQLESSVPGIYAAGDIAEYESVVHEGRRIRVEHWDVASEHGKTVAANMLGRNRAHDVVPYFFSDLSDWASLEYVGPASDWDHEAVRGSLDDGEFSIWYLENGRLAAALSVGRSDDLEHARRLIKDRIDLSGREHALADSSTDLASL